MVSYTVEEIIKEFDAEVEAIREDCVEEGYPSNGSNFEIRYANLYNWYSEAYPEVFGEE